MTSTLQVDDGHWPDQQGVIGLSLMPELAAVTEELRRFRLDHGHELPPAAAAAIDR
jgi:hypothetical protein